MENVGAKIATHHGMSADIPPTRNTQNIKTSVSAIL